MKFSFLFLLLLCACGGSKSMMMASEKFDENTVIIRYYWIPPTMIEADESENFSLVDLKKFGIEFKGDASIIHGGPTGFGMKNTFKNHEMLEKFLQKHFGDKWKRYQP